MKYISLILQSFLRILLIFCLTFIWVRYFIRQLWLAVLISGIITLILDIFIRLITRRKYSKNSMKIKEKEEAENMFLSLVTSTNYINFFFSIAKKENSNSVKKKNYILIENTTNKTLFYPFMSANDLTKDDIAKIIITANKEKVNKIVITCGEINKEAYSFSKSINIPIILLDKFLTYNNLYKYYDIYPEITMSYQKSKKLAFKEMLAFSFNKSRTKGYFLSAIVLLISTLFIRMNVYYCIMASLLIIFALISFFNPYFNIKENKIILRD